MKKIVLGLLLCWITTSQLLAQLTTTKGVTYSEPERLVWKGRAENGPFKVAGDAGVNSPGDWTRIVANAEAFNINPATGRYRIQPSTTTCVQTTTVALSPEGKGTQIRDAALYYLIKKDGTSAEVAKANSYAAKVMAELIKQMNERENNSVSSTQRLFDYNNTSRWCADVINDLPPSYYMAAWMERLRQAYDYTREYSGYTTQNRTDLETWFKSCAYYFTERNVDLYITSDLFTPTNRNNGTYTLRFASLGQYSTKPEDQLYYGSTKLVNISRSYNNRRGEMMRYVARVAIMTNDATLKNSVKLYFQEYMRFSVYPLGLINGRPYCLPAELHRGSDAAPEQGWQYSFDCVDQLVSMADAFARVGDSSLYAYQTSAGPLSLGGGPKSLKNLIYGFSCMQDKTLNVYCTLQSNREGNALYRLDGFDPINNRSYVMDSWLSVANRYYASKDLTYATRLTNIYQRKASGTNPWPAKPSGSGSSNGWTGSFGGGSPGASFMTGGTELLTSNNYLPSTPTRYDVLSVLLDHAEVSSTPANYLGYSVSNAYTGDAIRLTSRWVSPKSGSNDTLTLFFTQAIRADSVTILSGIPTTTNNITYRFSPDKNIRMSYYSGGSWTQFFSVDANLNGEIVLAPAIASCTRIRYVGLKLGGASDWTRVCKIIIRGAAVTP